MTPRRFRIDPRLVAALAAVLTGSVAYVAAKHHLAARERAVEARVAERHQKKAVLVARSPLAAGTVLDAGLLAARQVPVRYVSGSAALPQDLERVTGQRLLHDVDGGEPILWPALAGGRDATLSAGLVQGRRALTFPVDEVNALSGMLRPGDVIDLLYSGPGAGGAPTVRPLLQRVTVLATGSATAAQGVEHTATGERGAAFGTITLDVTPEQAQLITLAQRAGELTAVLRHPADAVLHAARPVDANALVEGAPARGVAVRRDYGDVITGGSPGVASRTRLLAESAASAPAATPRPEAATRRDVPDGTAEPADPGDLRTRLGLDRLPAP